MVFKRMVEAEEVFEPLLQYKTNTIALSFIKCSAAFKNILLVLWLLLLFAVTQ